MKRINILVAALFFLLTCIFLYPLKDGLILLPLDLLVSSYAPWFMAGQILLKNPYMQDAILQYFPWHHLVFESFRTGIIPFWNPYQMMGMPFMAGTKPMVFYPTNIFYIFGEVAHWHASIFLQVFLGMVFVYALLRDFKLGRLASIMSAISFSLSSLMIGLLEFVSDSHVLLWFPLFILLAKRFIDKKSGWNLFFLGISIAFSVFAGQLQYTGYGLIVLSGFILYYGFLQKTKLRDYIFLFVSIALGILLSSIQLLPALEFFSYSTRAALHSHFVFSTDLLFPNNLFRLFSPDFFGHPTERNLTLGYIESSGYFSIVSFFFALYAIIFSWKNKIVRFFAVVFVAAAVLALKGPAAELLYFLKLPLITNGSGGRIFALVMFSGPILAAFGLEEFLRGKIKKNILSLTAFSAIFALGIFLNYKRPLFFHDLRFSLEIFGIFLVASFIFLFWNKKSKLLAKIFATFLIALIFFDLFRFGYRYLTFSNPKFLYPGTQITKYINQSSKHTLPRSFGVTEPEIGTYLGLYSLEAYIPFYPQRSADLLQTLQKLPVHRNATDNKYYLTYDPNLKYALDFTGVAYVAGPKDFSPTFSYLYTGQFAASFQKIISDSRLDLYVNKDALPRFGLFYKYKVANSSEELKIISQRSFDPKTEVLLEEKLPNEFTNGTGSAKLISSNVNSQTFEVSTDKPALFYISDTYFPGWTAKINGKPTKIYRANYNFRAALVPAGRSKIEFSYLPTHFQLAILISAISTLLLVIISFIL